MKGLKDLKTIEKCYLMTGQEEWLKKNFIDQIKNQVLEKPDDIMNLICMEGKEVSATQIIEACETMPFFAEKKVVIVKDSGLIKVGKKEETDRLAKWLKTIPEYVVLILDENDIDKRNQLYKKIKANYSVVEFNYPGEQQVETILLQIAKERQGNIDQATLHYFISNMPQNINYQIKEFEKLLDYTKNQNASIADIQSVCVFSLEQQVFELVKKVVLKDTAQALEIYNTLIQRKESPLGVLVLIARQYRMMLQTKYLAKSNLPDKMIASQVGMPPFVVKEMIGQSKKYTFKQLEQLLEYCLQSDQAIKTGKLEPIKCVELLIIQCIYIE